MKEHPQFISRSHTAHRMMDVLVAGFFTIMIYETRRANHRVTAIPAPVQTIESQYVPGATPDGAGNAAWIKDDISCAICREIMHNPVSVLTNEGCCKFRLITVECDMQLTIVLL
jgi:hypothetical protein